MHCKEHDIFCFMSKKGGGWDYEEEQRMNRRGRVSISIGEPLDRGDSDVLNRTDVKAGNRE
jgi:hypothetical protein